jgi:hypothetical protein
MNPKIRVPVRDFELIVSMVICLLVIQHLRFSILNRSQETPSLSSISFPHGSPHGISFDFVYQLSITKIYRRRDKGNNPQNFFCIFKSGNDK